MKANTRKIMQSNWLIDYSRLYWRPQHHKSKHTKRRYDRMFKNRWRKEIKRQAKQELNEN